MARLSFLDNWASRASNVATLWPLLPAGVVSAVMAYLSTTVAWINQFGAFGWASTALLTFLAVSVALYLIGVSREKWVIARIEQDRAKSPDAVNPIDAEFTKRRIRLQDLVRPSTNYIRDKTFTDCQLLGPAVVALQNAEFNGSGFINCNWVVVKEGPIFNVIVLKNVRIRGGDVSDLTICVPEGMVPHLKQMKGFRPINKTGDPELDAREIVLGVREHD